MELIRNRQTAGLLVALCVLTAVAVWTVSVKKQASIARTCEALRADLKNSAFQNTLSTITAQSVIAVDPETKFVFLEKDAETVRPLASLTKLMTVRTVLKQNIPLDTVHTLTETDTAPYGSTPGMSIGAQFSIRDLMRASLVSSVNDAAEALAYSTGITDPDFFYKMMNAEATKNSWSSFSFSGATGLDSEKEPTALGNARDVSDLLYKNVSEYPDVFIFPQTDLPITSSSGERIVLKPTNEAIASLPLLVAGKTGYTLSAGGNLAVLWKHPFDTSYISAVVLGSTFTSRFSDITKIYTAVNSYLSYEQSLLIICKNA